MEKSILQPIDKFAYIPLFAAAALIALTILFLIIASARKTSKVSFVFFLSLICVLAGAVFTAMRPNVIYFSFTLAAGALLILPYAAVKAFSSKEGSEDEDDGKPGAVNGGKRYNVVYEEIDRSLSDIQKELLGRAAESISAPGAIDSILEYYTKQMIEYTHADGCMALLLDDFDDVLSVKHLEGSFVPPYLLPENIPHKQNRVDMSMKYAQFPLKENIFGEILSGSKAELITEPLKDERIVQNEKEDFLKCGSYIFVPFIAQSQAIGEIALSRDFGNEPFSDRDFDVAKKLADIMALGVRLITIHNDMIERSNDEKEDEIAARIQKSLLPAKLPLLPGITNGAFFSSAESICGDFYERPRSLCAWRCNRQELDKPCNHDSNPRDAALDHQHAAESGHNPKLDKPRLVRRGGQRPLCQHLADFLRQRGQKVHLLFGRNKPDLFVQSRGAGLCKNLRRHHAGRNGKGNCLH